MKLRIYQINGKRAPLAMYMSYNSYNRMYGSIDPKNYDLVFVGELKSRRTLEGVFRHFNDRKNKRPSGMRSLSVGDVVELVEPCGKTPAGFYFCDSVGFKRIDFDAALTVRRNNGVVTD